MFKRMLKVLRLKFLQKNVILSREQAAVVVSHDSFSRVHHSSVFLMRLFPLSMIVALSKPIL